VLRDRAALMRARVLEFANEFDTADIVLGSLQTLPRDYEAGHAFGREYNTASLPSQEELRSDLQQIVRAYLALTYRGGLDPTPEAGDATDAGVGPPPSLTEQRRYRLHRKIERNRKASAAAKRAHGSSCQACGFNFAVAFGQLGVGYIEAHHLRPLRSLTEGVAVQYDPVADFAVLCANCHRMIHRMDDVSDLGALKDAIALAKLDRSV
jgi:5-methylcytosine-specific restriction protein A